MYFKDGTAIALFWGLLAPEIYESLFANDICRFGEPCRHRWRRYRQAFRSPRQKLRQRVLGRPIYKIDD